MHTDTLYYPAPQPDAVPMPWLVMYSNNGDIAILDSLRDKQAECASTGLHDYFVPLEVTRHPVRDEVILQKRFIAGNYIFVQATKEDVLRLRQEPPFDATLRFLHPASSPTGQIYVTDEEIHMMREVVERMGGEAEYYVPSSKELVTGDFVCIHDGDFAGVKGVLESVKGHEGGSVVVALRDILAVRTPRIPAEHLQLLELARIHDSTGNSYTSRAYKKISMLLQDSERLLEEKNTAGELNEASLAEAQSLILRFSELHLNGKIKLMHAQAICNLLTSVGETDSKRFLRFKGMLP